MEPESNSDNENKRDKRATERAKGKKPVKATKKKNQTQKAKGSVIDSGILPSVESITQKAKGIVIDEAKILKAGKKTDTPSKSGEKTPDKRSSSKGKKMEGVVKSSYSLRSGVKEMDIDDVKPAATGSTDKKRKAKDQKKEGLQSPGSDTEEACKRIKRGRNNDDETHDKDGNGAPTTGSSERRRRVRSI